MKQKTWIVGVLFFLAVSAVCPLWAQAHRVVGGVLDRESLRDLDGIHVLVEDLRADAQKDGLTTEVVEEEVRRRLREAGVRYVGADRWVVEEGSPYLYVNVNTVKSEAEGLYVFGIDIRLNQTIRMVRNPQVTIPATTWTSGCRVGAVETKGLPALVDIIGESVQRFIEALEAVQTKTVSPEITPIKVEPQAPETKSEP